MIASSTCCGTFRPASSTGGASPSLAAASTGDVVTLKLHVDGHIPGAGSRQPHRVRCSDESRTVDLIYFHGTTDWLKRLLPVGERRAVSGRLESFHDMLQIVHPDHVGPIETFDAIAVVEPVYPLSAGIPARVLSKAVAASVDLAPAMPEWQDTEWVNAKAGRTGGPPSGKFTNPPTVRMCRPCHRPDNDSPLTSCSPISSPWPWCACRFGRRPGRSLCGDGHLRDRVIAALPYKLTGSQQRAVEDVLADMELPARMLRLLQGDVGSGKTVVGLLAMLNAVEAAPRPRCSPPRRSWRGSIWRRSNPWPPRACAMRRSDRT